MTLIYRALWQDEDELLTDSVRSQFLGWAEEKHPGIAAEGTVMDGPGGDSSKIVVEEGSGDLGDGRTMNVLRASLIETRNDGGSRWETKLRSWSVKAADGKVVDGWLWADVAAVGEDIDPRTLSPAAPKIVRALLGTSKWAHVNGIPIDAQILRYRGAAEGEALAELISSVERKLPIAVFADTPEFYNHLPQSAPYALEDIVSQARNKIAGIGRVAVVDSAAASAMTEALGEAHGLWGGAFRIYMRDVDPAVPNNAGRHRYVLPSRYAHHRGAAAHIIARALSPVSAVQRPPESFDVAKEILDRSVAGDSYEVLYHLAIEESEARKQDVIELREQMKVLNEQIDGQIIDAEILTETLNQSRADNDLQARHIAYLQKQLSDLNDTDKFFTTSEAAYLVTVPTQAESATEAVDLARLHLSDYLTIHDKAVDLDDLEKLDTANAASAIAANAWNGFRALHAYAQAMEQPGNTDSFWTWCQNTDHPWKWRATPTSLAMRESKTVSDHPETRTFPVSVDVDPAGRMYMDKHLKFDTNGVHAPRIYFHFDAARSHAHVGFFGPHTRLKNSTT